MIRFSEFKSMKGLSFWINHIGGNVLIVFICFYVAKFVLSLFVPDYIISELFVNSVLWRFALGLMYFFIIMLVYYLILNYSYYEEKKNAEIELKNLVKESELEALKSQINPHFLFNSLNSISSLTMIDAQRAQEMIIKLSDFLRNSLKYAKNETTELKEELHNIQLYLEIEKIRFGNKLNFEFVLHSACEKCKLPNMILQPLFENAVKFGVQESSGRVTISSVFELSQNMLLIEVRNNYESNVPSRKGRGVGLKNIRKRLELIYELTDLMNINRVENEYIVQLKIPQSFNYE